MIVNETINNERYSVHLISGHYRNTVEKITKDVAGLLGEVTVYQATLASYDYFYDNMLCAYFHEGGLFIGSLEELLKTIRKQSSGIPLSNFNTQTIPAMDCNCGGRVTYNEPKGGPYILAHHSAYCDLVINGKALS